MNLVLKEQLKFVLVLTSIMAGIEVLNMLTGRHFNQYGIIPREFSGLTGIFFAPLLHGSILHFFSNVIPFALFSFLLLQYGISRYIRVTLICTLVGGVLVWVFGRSASHVGASGLIYGYFGYLVLAGFITKKIKHILISLFIAFFYGTLVWGVLPSNKYISWEGHLFGFLVGLSYAYNMRKHIK
jgi:membrane associated rhomboid family serine protease